MINHSKRSEMTPGELRWTLPHYLHAACSVTIIIGYSGIIHGNSRGRSIFHSLSWFLHQFFPHLMSAIYSVSHRHLLMCATDRTTIVTCRADIQTDSLAVGSTIRFIFSKTVV